MWIVAGALAFLLVGFALGSYALGTASRDSKLDEVRRQLKNAATAEESYRVDHDHYTKRQQALEDNGFAPSEQVRLLIPLAYDEFCLEAQHDELGAIWHYSSTEGEPREGRCR